MSDLSGQIVPGLIVAEGTFGSGNVATFSDANLADTVGSFSATIDWGDGTTTTGTISSSGAGLFTVAGSHTYADEGAFTAIATLTRTSDNVQAAPSGTITVTEADILNGTPTTFHVDPNQAFSGTVATFTDAYTGQVASDLTATISWGDGTFDVGTITGGAGTFTVSGTHTYSLAGQDSVTVTLSDDAPGTATATVISTAAVGFPGSFAPIPITAIEGVAIPPGTVIAAFTDGDPTDTGASFSATIDWGDGTTSTGSVVGGGGFITVLGSGHIYADEGVVTPIVTLTHTADNVTGTATGPLIVAEGDSLAPSPIPHFIHANPNQPFSGTVATFTDTDTNQVASDLTATIVWGDGTTDVGTVSGGGGSFTVSGTHTYATVGTDAVSVKLADDSPGIANATANSTAAVGFLGSLAPIPRVEGVPIGAGSLVAAFTDPDPTDTPASFTATIDWGDGTTTPGAVTIAFPGSVTVLSTGHTYADEGSFTPIVTLIHSADGVTGTATGTISVAENDILVPLPVGPIAPQPNQLFSGVLGIFGDPNPSQTVGDFTATINWGDGTTSVGTVSGAIGGPFTVSGTHTYATSAVDTITATLSDDAPGTAHASQVTTVTVGLPGTFALTVATEHTPLAANTTVATFADGNLADTAASFTATINWGDGATTSGTVVGAAGSFSVDGGHAYAIEGNFQATATLTRTADNVKGVASGSIAVAEGPTIPEDFAGIGFSGVLWRQTNPQTFAQNFVQWSMNGASVTASQNDTFQGNIILPDASWNVRGTGDFNGDGKSDILWQHADGSLTAWLMNDSTIVSDGPLKSQGQIVAPNSSWSVAGTGDFDGDARDDILWRKTDGSLVEWLMNGTTISSTQTPTFQGKAISPDASWNVAAMGDFDGDGHQDIMWRNTSSNALQDWSMNGGTVTSSQAPTFQGSVVTPDSSWSIVAAGDFNRDDKTDLLWRQAGTGPLQEWQMNGSQITSSQIVKFQGSQVTPDASWSVVEIGDFNGDGKSDVLWRQSGTGALSEWLMDGAQITASNTVNPALDSSWQVQSKPTNFA
jgi:hypothetical protein